jgi:rod shape-determining protein MreD
VSLVKTNNRWLIVTTYLLALLLSVLPLTFEARWLRPEFLCIFVIYWVVFSPNGSSLLLVFLMGCLQDLLEGSFLGRHALALLCVSYLCLLFEQRFKYYVAWQQAFLVFGLVLAHQFVDHWVHSLQGASATSFDFLMPAFTSALLWPLIWMLLDRARVSFRVA